MMTRAAFLAVLLLAVSLEGLAGPSITLKKGRICDQEKTMCLKGNLAQDDTGNVITFVGRVAKTSGPGVVSILLRGTDSKRHPCTTFFEFPIRGRSSEIVDEEQITGKPGIKKWRVISVTFEPYAE